GLLVFMFRPYRYPHWLFANKKAPTSFTGDGAFAKNSNC
ncbi:MAG: hypothetical protein ACI8SJ_001581, partial [Shewanella sp.]